MQTYNLSKCYGILVAVFCTSLSVFGQLDQSPKIYSLHIRSDIQFRFATTLVTSRVANPANYSQETKFEVILPEEAFISNFTLEIDGVIYPGIVKDKDEAKKEYEKAKKKGKTTGLVSQKPRESRKFKVQIAVAAFSKSTFNLTYQELLKRVKGAYEHRIFVKPGYPVDDLQVSVAIQESRDITTLSVPPIKALNELLTAEEDITENPLAVITRPTKRSAFINYVPGHTDQGTEGLSGKFTVQYDIDRSLDGGDVLVVNGYFVHFLAPDVQYAIPKDVLFILDTSGSMGGRKIEQLKDAMYIVIDELKEGDRFNIITFTGGTKKYRPTMIDVTRKELFKAKEYIKSIRAFGGTDINEAILEGIDALKVSKQEGERSPVVVFLTDGHPTSGVTNYKLILKNIEHANEGEIPVFSLAFGTNAAWELVKKMAIQNNGVGRKIYEDSDADLQISGFYDELAVTLLNNVSVKYLDDAVDTESLTKSEFKNYFRGSEMVVAGKLTDPGAPTVDLEIFSNSLDGALVLTVDKDSNFIDVSDVKSLMGLTDFQEITEKTWAYLTIKQLLNRAEGETNQTAVDLMKSRAKGLSLQYGFVTPLTSMVVTKPEVDPDEWRPPKPGADVSKNQRASAPTGIPPGVPGIPPGLPGIPPGIPSGRQYRMPPFSAAPNKPRYSTDNDPHFIVNVKKLDHAICFDVMGEEGDVYKLLTDANTELTVDAKVVANKNIVKKSKVTQHSHSNELKTFLGEITIKRRSFAMSITPTKLQLLGETVDWSNDTTLDYGDTKIIFDQAGSRVMIMFDDRVTFLVMRHLKSKSLLRAGKVNFLGLYIVDYKGLSYHTHGLLGQFLHRNVILMKTKLRNGKLMGRLKVSGNTKRPRKLMATLGHRLNLATNETVSCWMVQHNGGDLLDGKITDYLVKRNEFN